MTEAYSGDDERRGAERFQTRFPVFIKRSNEASHHVAYLQDISTGGCSCFSSMDLSEGEEVAISFPLIEKRLAVESRLIWTKRMEGADQEKYHYGFHFTDRNDSSQSKLVERICEFYQSMKKNETKA